MPETAPAPTGKLEQLDQLGALAFEAKEQVGFKFLEKSGFNLSGTIAETVGVTLNDIAMRMTARVLIGKKGGPIERTIMNRLDQPDFHKEGGVPQIRDSKNNFVFPLTTLQFISLKEVSPDVVPPGFYDPFKKLIKDSLGEMMKEMVARKQRMNETDLKDVKLLITCGIEVPDIRDIGSRLQKRLKETCKEKGIKDIDPEFFRLLNEDTEKARVQIMGKLVQTPQSLSKLADLMQKYVSGHIDLVLQYAHGTLDFNLQRYMQRISQGVERETT
jgi:hypothetical protein